MLTHWNKILNTDCTVIKLQEQYIYPIFKNGSSKMFLRKRGKFRGKFRGKKIYDKTDVLLNDEIGQVKELLVILRDPEDRFITGVNKVAELENVTIEDVMHRIKHCELIDRHFMPQFIWLLHLSKYFKGTVHIRPMSELDNIFDDKGVDEWPQQDKKQVTPLDNYTHIDKLMIEKYMDKDVELKTIIEDLIYVLPKA